MMPPKEELFRPFDNVSSFWYRRKKIFLEWHFDNGALFFRPQNADIKFLWKSARGCSATILREKLEEIVANRLSDSYSLPFSHRLVWFAPAGESAGVWLTPRPYHIYGVTRPNSNRGLNWPVRLDWKGDYWSFQSAPTEFFVEAARCAIEQNPAEWQRILEWTLLSPNERFWSCVSWKCGDKEEWEELMQALLQLVLSQVPALVQRSWPIFVLRHPRFPLAPLRLMRGQAQKEFPGSVWDLLALSEGYFSATIDYSYLTSIKREFYSLVFRPKRIIAQVPTQHELMAALDLWRDFGRKSGELPQVETCLRQLLT